MVVEGITKPLHMVSTRVSLLIERHMQNGRKGRKIITQENGNKRKAGVAILTQSSL